MSDIVLSMLLRRVLGLVIVVPRLAWRPCPRLKGTGGGPVGDAGDAGVLGPEVLTGVTEPVEIACSRACATPAAGGGVAGEPSGDAGPEDRIALPSSDSASYRSGGRRSFSISDLRLGKNVRGSNNCERRPLTRPRNQ